MLIVDKGCPVSSERRKRIWSQWNCWRRNEKEQNCLRYEKRYKRAGKNKIKDPKREEPESKLHLKRKRAEMCDWVTLRYSRKLAEH